MLLCHYSDRLELEWGKPVRIVTAHPINKKYQDEEYDFYKELYNGNAACRNLYSSMTNGYRVAFPGHELGGYFGNGKAQEEDWSSLKKKISCFPSHALKEYERNMLIWAFPGFVYVLNKWKGSLAEVMEVLSIWQKNPEIELLLAGGYEQIAMNHAFWRLTEKKRKEICKWLRSHERFNYSLSEVQQRIKWNLDDNEWANFQTWNNSHYGPKVGYELYKYLKKQEEKANPDTYKKTCDWIKETYTDYKKSFESEYCTHDFKDPYWKYPKDLWAAHTRVNDEINAAIALEREQHRLEQEKDKRNCFKRLRRVAEKYGKYNAEVDGYSIFFTGSMKDWNYQAKELHQCIVASRYFEGMAKKKYLIAFIRREGIPIATAQLYAGEKIGTWRIGQFYANELDRSNCRPSDEVQAIFNKWLETVPIKEAI